MEKSISNSFRHQIIITSWHWSWPTVLVTGLLTLFSLFIVNHSPREYTFSTGTNKVEPYLKNLYSPESNKNFSYRWTAPTWFIIVPDFPQLSTKIRLSLLSLNPEIVKVVDASGAELYNFRPTDHLQEYEFDLPANSIRQNQLYISIKSPSYSAKGDPRSLGLILSRVEIIPQRAFILPPLSLILSLVGAGLGFSWLLASIVGMLGSWKKRPSWYYRIVFAIVLVFYLPAWFSPQLFSEFQISRLFNLVLLGLVVIFALACSFFVVAPALDRLYKRVLGKNQEKLFPASSLVKDGAFLMGLGLLTATFLIFTLFPTFFELLASDVKNFHNYILAMGNGKMPYRDFTVEYPPFSLVFIVFPALVSNIFDSTFNTYLIAFQGETYFMAVGLLFVVRSLLLNFYKYSASYRRRMIFFSAILPIISLYIFRRFDVGAVLLVALAFYFIYFDHPGWAGICLGLATTSKLYPFLVLPFLFLYFVRNKGDWKIFLRIGAGYLIALVTSILPIALISFSGLLESLKYQLERGLQIESLFASFVWLGSEAGLVEAVQIKDHKSAGYLSNWNDWLLPASSLLIIGGLLAFFIYGWWLSNPTHFRLPKQWPILASFQVIGWFIITNKVISPQYMLWLLPFLPFLGPWKAWLGGLIITLGTIDYLFLDAGVREQERGPMFIVLVRNSLLLLLIILQFRDFWLVTSQEKHYPPAVYLLE